MRSQFSVGLVLACFSIAYPLTAQETAFTPLGLPAMESSLPIFSRYPAPPPLSARIPLAGEWFLLPQLQLSQGMTNGLVGIAPDETVMSFFDYESLSLELPVLVGLGKGWTVGTNLKVAYLSGGFLDEFIQKFHGVFGFPNNSRDRLPLNAVAISLDTKNQVSFQLDHPVWMLADPVLMLGFNVLKQAGLELSLSTQISLPLGLGHELMGSSLPVVSWGGFADWSPVWWLGLHGTVAWIVPGEALTAGGPFTMFQARLAAIFNPGWDVLPFIQFNFQTSPFSTDVYDGDRDYFATPNADLYIGVMFAGPRGRQEGAYGAFCIQEDPFSHNAADISFVGAGAFRLGK